MKLSSRGLIVDGLILCAWFASLGLVMWQEQGMWGGSGNPATTLVATLEAKEQWFSITYQGHRVGFTQMTLVPSERDGVPGVEVSDRGRLSFALLGAPQQLDVSARAFIDADWRVQVFTASLRSSTMDMTWAGQRHGDALDITVKTPNATVAKRLRDPHGAAFITGLSSWAAFHRLRAGQTGTAWVLNPLAMNPEPVHFVVRRTERFENRTVFVVESEVSGLIATTWVTPEGEVLKESSPLGWELHQTSREDAMKSASESHATLDLLSMAAVPLDRPIDHPETVTQLTLLVEGLRPDDVPSDRPWQQVLGAEQLQQQWKRQAPAEPWSLVRIRGTQHNVNAVPANQPRLRYRHATTFVQSEDPRIIAKARDIIGTRTDPWEQALAINDWTHHTITKQLSVGLPSAVDILATPVGDCHEHTVLFTALARSVGIPTRMDAGLVYWDGKLYYHAWPEVWVEHQWVPMDPTLGQPIADATHLILGEAEDESLIALGQFIGKLRMTVLEITHD